MRTAWVIAFVVLLACSKRDAADVAAPAGKVVEVAGTVSATRNGASRKLAVADQLFSDETVDTGSDGSVTIELSHNHARWAMEPGQKKRVDESAAWKLAEQTGSAVAIDHATSAAGRNAERTAAETQATAGVSATGGGAAGSANGSLQQAPQADPPKPPEPPKLPTSREKTAGKGSAQGDAYATADTEAPKPDVAALIDAHYSEISACYVNRNEKIVVTIHVVKGVATLEDKGAGAERRRCVDAALAKIKLPKVDQTVTITLGR
jgi:hypothetical protein